jgi:type II secretory pathway predicted ATPase ExeA/pSer/pThr/pTyr-binding forkhead associated (FHA) protein
MTPQHSRAVANIRFALMNRDSFVIITGEIGIGKTTVLNTVLEELGRDFVTAKITHTTLSHIELLQALLSAFGMPMYTKKKVLLLDTLREFFLQKNKEGKHVVIIVDEAQNLSAPALEELRLLSCIDTADRKIVSIALTGQRGLDDVIDSPGLAQLRQRARLRQRLEALTEEETFAYIHHRLEVAGGDSEALFEPDAVREIHRLAFGIPRLVNTLCDTAMMSCMVDEQRQVTVDTVDAVVQELRWQWFDDRDQEKSSKKVTYEPDSKKPSITLTVYRAGQFVEQVQSSQFPFVMGRSNANELVIIDKEVSRRHALIDCISGIFVIEDLNSKNGILVNRKHRSRALLRTGDTITVGQLDISFQITGDDPADKKVGTSTQEHVETVVIDESAAEEPAETNEPTGKQKIHQH